ncbi:LysR family transcriptional regulator [Variovorax sp. dw_308]|uniref:LysR family transcriptional regulator n=1 Tax=Variovorax sp. dw_308 TaxID=2721546 RepID=UPI001C45D4F9|nr:LysR family transcriptional regulator [Variovorax sp. dw_308]
MDLHEIDLNLLVVFNQLLMERRVSGAADTLGLTQPAVSNALARLRKLLGDELFLRTPGGMVPTPRAQLLAQPVADALALLHGAMNQRISFDPATSQRSFNIGMSDIGEIYFLPTLMDALKAQAPQVRISTVRNSAVNLSDAMSAGQVDLALGLLPQLKAGFLQRRLFPQGYVCVFRKSHALDFGSDGKRRITLAEFAAADHVVVEAAGTGHGRVEDALQRRGIQRTVRLRVPHFVAVGHILAGTDMIATLPQRLAEKIVEPFGLTWVKHPAPLPDTAITLFWHARYHQDPANQWLREVIFGMFAR